MIKDDEVTLSLENRIQNETVKCWNCNFCISSCPIIPNTGGFYSHGGSGLTQSLFYAVKWRLIKGPESKELMHLIYRCTTCNSCVNRCKELSAGIPLLEIIKTGRKLLVENAVGPALTQRKTLENIFKYGNPYGKPAKKRLNWQKEVRVKHLPEDPAEVLLFIGCSGSYDPALQIIAKSIVSILKHFNVNFGILREEKCSGDVALQLGDEALFLEVASSNISAFRKSGVKIIVTLSPHDFNSFLKDYPDLQPIDIKHYTQFIADLISCHKVELRRHFNEIITYHDPCYLSKHNNITEQPRKILSTISELEIKEIESYGRDSLCCGGGGGRMFADFEEDERLSDIRIKQALKTNAHIIATACPWCNTMLNNSIKDLKLEQTLKVMDVAEMFATAISV